MREELNAVKAVQHQQDAPTAAGLNGLASTGMTTGLSAAHASLLDLMKSQVGSLVAAEQPRPCHCPDVDSNTARIAYLEVALATLQAAGTGAPTCTVASTFGATAGSEDGLPPFVKKAAAGNG